MSAMPHRRRFPAAVLIMAGCLALAGGLATLGRDEPARPVLGARKPTPELKEFIHGSRSCAGCHETQKNYRDAELNTMLCRMIEWPIWDKDDKHKNAFRLLSDDRGKSMGERLGIDPAKSSACINCHGLAKPEGVESNRFDQVEDGVTCVACHGAHDEWVKEHQTPNKKSWRGLTRIEKEQQFGMTDLWDPVTRSKKCASCHIGDPKADKVVTHAMYAAGHPPLPGLEVATFSDAQPRHWQYLREKKTKPDVVKDLHFNPRKREQTELVAVSGIVALRETMALYAAQARGHGLVKEPETQWPDFARFDCYACHHDLQVPSWRQARGFDATPGRPPAPTWPAVLVQLGILVADPEGKNGRAAEFEQKVDAFHRAMGNRPFGNGERAIESAQALADWADEVSRDLRELTENPDRVAVDGPLTLRLLRKLCEMSDSRVLDYDSARQIALAFRTIYAETMAIDPDAIPDPAIPEILKSLDRQFVISLPSEGTQVPIEKTLLSRLKAVVDFDPVAFRARFAELQKHLPPR